MADGDSDEEQVMDAETDKRVDAALDNDGASVSYMGMLKLLRRVALMLKDGEQTEARVKEGLDEFVLENDDAVDTLHEIITEAREITGEKPHGLAEDN